MGEDILSNQNGVRERTTLAYEVVVRSASGTRWQRHLFFDREDALDIVRHLTEGVVNERRCIALRTDDGTDGVRVGLYGRYGGSAEAFIEMRGLW